MTCFFLLWLLLLALVRGSAIPGAGLGRDTAFHYEEACDLLAAGRFPVTGPPMTEMDGARVPGGFAYLLLMGAFAVSADPRAGFVLGLALFLCGLVIVFRTLRRTAGPLPALLACLLLGASPWHASSDFWTPWLLFPFAAVFFSACRSFFIEGKAHAFPLACLALALLGQLHFAALLLLGPPFFWMAVRFFVKKPVAVSAAPRQWAGLPKNPVNLLCGALAFLVPYLPYLAAEIGSGFTNSAAMLAQAGASRPASLQYLYFVPLFLTNEVSVRIGRDAASILAFYTNQGLPGWLGLGMNLASLLLFLPLLLRLFAGCRRPTTPEGFFPRLLCRLLLWAAVPFLILRIGSYPHYLFALFPLPALAVFGAWPAYRSGLRRLLTVFTLANTTFLLALGNPALDTLPVPDRVPVADLRMAAARLVESLGEAPVRFLLPDPAQAAKIRGLARHLLGKPLAIDPLHGRAVLFDSDRRIDRTALGAEEQGAAIIACNDFLLLLYPPGVTPEPARLFAAGRDGRR